MLLATVVCSTIAVCIANPLHKYPYVFLLDVGNEELEKTNTEQLRVSIPGGSLAVKYPAMGEGDPIGHIRVSGIDFGTDLKVNIVGGGPGYNYVVLMFMGNPGVSYDAVVTLQTIQTGPKGTEMNTANSNKFATTEESSENSYEVSDANSDENDEESINDFKNMKQHRKNSNEVMQSTSTFYNYAKSEAGNTDEDKEIDNISAEQQDVNEEDDDDSVDEEDENDNDSSNNGDQQISNEHKLESSYQDDRNVSEEEEEENSEDENVKTKLYSGQDFDQFRDIPRAEQYRYNPSINSPDNAKPDSIHEKYQEVPHFGLGFRVYPQSFIYNKQYQDSSAYNKGDSARFAQMINNQEDSNDPRFRDGSNNIDSDYLVAEY